MLMPARTLQCARFFPFHVTEGYVWTRLCVCFLCLQPYDSACSVAKSVSNNSQGAGLWFASRVPGAQLGTEDAQMLPEKREMEVGWLLQCYPSVLRNWHISSQRSCTIAHFSSLGVQTISNTPNFFSHYPY